MSDAQEQIRTLAERNVGSHCTFLSQYRGTSTWSRTTGVIHPGCKTFTNTTNTDEYCDFPHEDFVYKGIEFASPDGRQTRLVKLKNFCLDSNITLNDEEGNAPHQHGDFLGLHYNYNSGEVCLGKKTLNKLNSIEIPDKATRREYLAIFGLVLFATRALKVHPAKFFTQIKFIRKRCCAGNLDEEVAIWPSCVKGFQLWISQLRTNKPVRHEIGEPLSAETILFTDASVTGWGAVLMSGGDVYSTAGR